MPNNFGEPLRAACDYLTKGQAIPNNTNTDGNGGEFPGLFEAQGAVEIVVVAKTAISIADTKSLTIKLRRKPDGGAYADLVTIYTGTASGAALTFAAGAELGRYLGKPGDTGTIKANIASTDTAGAGTIDIYQRFVAR